MVTEKKQELTDGLESSGGELEGLKQEKEALSRELEFREATIAKLKQELTDKDSEVTALKQAMAEAEKRLTDVNDALAKAVASYKALVVESGPGVLAELITGDTVDEVDESLKNAKILIDRVRQEIEEETSKTKVPAGAPQRAPLDMSALSPREKIQYAIGGFSS